MLRVKGIYDGAKVVLLSPLSVPPNTAVEIVVAEQPDDLEQLYWQRLLDRGLIKEIRIPASDEPSAFIPVQISGTPISQTIIEERR